MDHIIVEICKEILKVDLIKDANFNKFDDFYFSTDNYTFYLQGIITNSKELERKYEIKDFKKEISQKIYDDINFIKEFRGSFYGYIIDDFTKNIIIFNDQIGSKNVFYKKKDGILISTSYKQFFRNNTGLNVEAAYMLLSYGYMLNDTTILNNVKRLPPGSLLYLSKKGKVEIKSYYKLSAKKNNVDETNLELILDKIDFLFRRAVKRQFGKDKDLKSKHLVCLSGGLDSRMTSWVAHEMGYIDQVNFTFSQSNYLDETIPKKIASDLKHDWVFKFLDNGNFLYDIDEITSISGGNVLYYGLAHNNSFLKLLKLDNFGLLHTGQIGDVVIGSFMKSNDFKNLNELGGMYSDSRVKNNLPQFSFKTIEDKEIAMFYQRAFNGANSGLMLINHYLETYSPFYDLDFMEYCLALPIKLRMNHYLYKQWVIKKYPKATDYIWESTKRKITTKEPKIKIFSKKIYLFDLPKAFFRKLKLTPPPIATKQNMNPLQYWYNTNPSLQVFMDNYYKNNLYKLSKYPSLRKDSQNIYSKGSAIQKNQVLSLLSLIDRI